MKRFFFLMIVILFVYPLMGNAEGIVFPDDLTVIENEAFYGCQEFDELVIPEGVQKIGDRAFAECDNLENIYIPGSVTELGSGVFEGIETPLLIKTAKGSAAMDYAMENGIDFQAGTKRRALLIGQSSYSFEPLAGPATDVNTMRRVLGSGSLAYSSTIKTNLSAGEIISSIGSVFGDAQDSDISLFYYSGHGVTGDGSLVGVDDDIVTPRQLRNALDGIPGRKIVIIDACHSGVMVGRSVGDAASSFTGSFLSGFKSYTSKSLRGQDYYVMVSSHSEETSQEVNTEDFSFGLFTYALARGLGYDCFRGSTVGTYADANGDQVVTFNEAYQYARNEIKNFIAGVGWKIDQNAQVWPSNCNSFGFIR